MTTTSLHRTAKLVASGICTHVGLTEKYIQDWILDKCKNTAPISVAYSKKRFKDLMIAMVGDQSDSNPFYKEFSN